MFVIPIGVIREYEDIKKIPFDKKSELVEEIIKDKEENKDNLSNENKDTNINNVEKEIQPMEKEELVTPIKQENTGLSNKTRYKHDLMKAFKSSRLRGMFDISFFTTFLPFLIVNTFKSLGSFHSINQTVLKLTQSGNGIVLCFMNPLFGFLADKFPTKTIMLILNVYGVVVGILRCFSLYNNVIFAISVLMNSVWCYYNFHPTCNESVYNKIFYGNIWRGWIFSWLYQCFRSRFCFSSSFNIRRFQEHNSKYSWLSSWSSFKCSFYIFCDDRK